MRGFDPLDAGDPPVERLVGDELPVPGRVQRAPGRFCIDRWYESLSARRNFVFGPLTLITGCKPMVLVTTPPQPASKARRMLLSDSVGGADESRNGLRNCRPVNVTDKFTAIALHLLTGGLRPAGPPAPSLAGPSLPASAKLPRTRCARLAVMRQKINFSESAA